MKKILIINKFYYSRGGDCIYTLSLERLLLQHGHEVAIFSMQHPKNLPSAWSSYFPSEVDYSNSGKKNNLKEVLVRPLGSKEVKNQFIRLLDDFQPEIIHLNNIHSQLSPILARIAYQKGIKVIWTLHDYKLLCSRSDCLRQDQHICEKCYFSKCNVIRYRCMKNNLAGSILAYIEAKRWNRKILERYTSSFICPSSFMKQKMIQGAFSEKKLHVLNNFIEPDKVWMENYNKADYYCYLGRISAEKGVDTLLQVASTLPYPLMIIGEGPLSNYLQSKYPHSHIKFLGKMDWPQIKEALSRARFSVIPSEWYENNPLAAIESLSLGTPVLGADTGGIPELISEGKNGLLFEMKNTVDLRRKIVSLYENPFSLADYREIAKDACKKFASSSYYHRLMDFYEEEC